MPFFNDSSTVEEHPQANLLGFNLIEVFFNKDLTELEVSLLEKGIDALFSTDRLTTEIINSLDEQAKGRLLICGVLSTVPPGRMDELFILWREHIKSSLKILTLSALLSGDETLINQYLFEISKNDIQSLVRDNNFLLLTELSKRGRLLGIEKVLHSSINDTVKIKDLLGAADFQSFIVSAQSYGDTQAKLIEIFIEKEPTTLTDVLFRGCTGLTALTLPQGLTTVGESAFLGCTRLTALTLPQGLTTVGDSAFWGCTGLTALTLPQGLTHIGDAAFRGCTGLTQIIINTDSDVELARIQALLPEEHPNKVIKNPVYDRVILIQKENYPSFSARLRQSPIYNQKAERINQLPGDLIGMIDVFDERGYLMFYKAIKGIEIPTAEEGLKGYKESLESLIGTLSASEQAILPEKVTIQKNNVSCINKLQQYLASVDSKKIEKEKKYPNFFSENKGILLKVERESAVIEKVITYLEGDKRQVFSPSEISLINKGLIGKFISDNEIHLPEEDDGLSFSPGHS